MLPAARMCATDISDAQGIAKKYISEIHIEIHKFYFWITVELLLCFTELLDACIYSFWRFISTGFGIARNTLQKCTIKYIYAHWTVTTWCIFVLQIYFWRWGLCICSLWKCRKLWPSGWTWGSWWRKWFSWWWWKLWWGWSSFMNRLCWPWS